MLRSDTTAFRATTSHHRDLAHTVLSTTYAQEKQWVDSARDVFPAGDLSDDAVTWIVATVDDEPAGVVRIHYAPPLHRYQEYGLESLGGDGHSGDGHSGDGHSDGSPSFGGAGVDAYVTDVFEGEEHSPYNFHTRVLGFRPVATHEMGEMDCLHRRITLILNLKQAYRRLRKTKNRLYRFLAEGLSPQVRRQLSA